MSFQEYSKSIVRDFLGSVAFIDDRIFSAKPVTVDITPTKELDIAPPAVISTEVPNVTPLMPVTKKISITPRAHVPLTKDELESNDQVEKAVIKTEDIDIDPKEFMSAFTKEGIHCSLCEYVETDLGSYKTLLQKSDVAILDWNMNSGKPEGTEACLLIEDLLAVDKESSLRLIVIYSSTSKVQWNEILDKRIKPLFGDRETSLTDFSIISGHTKIVFVHKGDPTILPTRIIDEFVEMTSGLVSNSALNAITTIRKNSHKLLGVYNKELDPGYLSHKMLLPNPEDSNEQIYDLIGSEIKSIIKSDNYSEELDMLSDYFDQNYKDYTSNFDFKAEADFTEEFALTLPEELDKEMLFKLTTIGIENVFIKGNTSVTDRFTFTKRCHLHATKYFTNSLETAAEINKKFSMLSSMKKIYNTKDIYLQQGTVVTETKNKEQLYWLCVQPKCDSIRINKTRDFIFVKLKKIQIIILK